MTARFLPCLPCLPTPRCVIGSYVPAVLPIISHARSAFARACTTARACCSQFAVAAVLRPGTGRTLFFHRCHHSVDQPLPYYRSGSYAWHLRTYDGAPSTTRFATFLPAAYFWLHADERLAVWLVVVFYTAPAHMPYPTAMPARFRWCWFRLDRYVLFSHAHTLRYTRTLHAHTGHHRCFTLPPARFATPHYNALRAGDTWPAAAAFATPPATPAFLA